MASSTPLALASALAEKTERSPLLYAWLTVQVAFLLALGYGAYRLLRAWRTSRRSRG
ncbi:hypothetical protein LN042_36060 [Kitasatospora sp. RB6PN24]|uniref:hypothetical protein n=1 Tax=Kitasatospora humi TaxID=2893891 RepID=UPI001E2FDC79|nr:hypothetical protein [Kitasatospora humi]MCC9312407.1 hypothetical protein [Kitasatospora humi]